MLEISASKLDCYLTCPLKYRFRYIDLIERDEVAAALAFGSAVHGTIKHVYKKLMSGQRLTIEEAEASFIREGVSLSPTCLAYRDLPRGLDTPHGLSCHTSSL